MQNLAIGMFDSGLGGLTVMQQFVRAFPHEDIVYFGDTARLPYGAKSRETILRYSIENSSFLIHKHIKMIVVACNTASAHALEELQQRFNIPVIGVIDPGVESALQASKSGRIGVLGTQGTINSQSYQKNILQKNPQIMVFPVACPLFVSLVEEGWVDHPVASLIVHEYLKPLKEHKVDTVLLGCTHYPLLKELICRELGDGVMVIDSAASCAAKVSKLLTHGGMGKLSEQPPVYRYFVSDDPKKFQALGSVFLGMPISHVELVQ